MNNSTNRPNKKRNITPESKCIVCGKLAGSKNERSPLNIDPTVHQSLVEFLDLPALFLQEKGIKAHKFCSYLSCLKMFLTNDDQLRLDIVQLKEEYENLSMSGLGKNETEQQQNVEQLDSSSGLTSETSEILRFNLRSIFHTLEVEPPSSDESSFSKQVLELKNHDKTYDFTFLPNEIVDNILEKEKKTYLEQVSKVQYDLLKQQHPINPGNFHSLIKCKYIEHTIQ